MCGILAYGQKIKSACLYEASGILCVHLFVLVFALLVSNAARSFASGLARSLALAATAVVNSLNDILGVDCLDSVHWYFLP